MNHDETSRINKIGVFITVGMSFWENIIENEIDNYYEKILNENCRKWDSYSNIREKIYESKRLPLIEKYEGESLEKLDTAEANTFKSFIESEDMENVMLYVYLVPTEESKDIAEKLLKPAIKKFLNNKSMKLGAPISVRTLEHKVGDENEFLKALDEIIIFLQEFIIGKEENDGNTVEFDKRYFLISGGFKGFIPIISILGMMHRNSYIVYRHEKGTENIVIYPIPQTPDFSRLDSLRSVLPRHTLDRRTIRAFLYSYPEIGGFFDKYGRKTKLGEFFEYFYKKKRKLFGRGEDIFDRITDNKLRNDLKEKLGYWEYLWIGDQIPETVEHSRKHSLRLLEYASHILNFFPRIAKDLGDEGLFTLYSSIWLHDFGHSIMYFDVKAAKTCAVFKCLKESVKRELLESSNNYKLIAVDPDLVRKYHNVFTVNMLNSNFKFLIPGDDNLKNAILLACLYHRKKMPVSSKAVSSSENGQQEGEFLEECLYRKDIFQNVKDSFKHKVLLAASLLSFIDGLDVQTDRVVSKEYKEIRRARDAYEIDYHIKALKSIKLVDLDPAKGILSYLETLKEIWQADSLEELNGLLNFARSCGFDGQKNNQCPERWRELRDKYPKLLEELINIKEVGEEVFYHIKRILFIAQQKEHFMKHETVDFVYLEKSGEKELTIHIVPNKMAHAQRSIFEKIRIDIRKEYEKIESVIKQYFVLDDIKIDDVS